MTYTPVLRILPHVWNTAESVHVSYPEPSSAYCQDAHLTAAQSAPHKGLLLLGLVLETVRLLAVLAVDDLQLVFEFGSFTPP